MNATWIYPFIILGGALQTCGAAMSAQLFQHAVNRSGHVQVHVQEMACRFRSSHVHPIIQSLVR